MNKPTIKSIQNEIIKTVNKQIESSIESYSHTEELQGFDGFLGLIEKEPKEKVKKNSVMSKCGNIKINLEDSECNKYLNENSERLFMLSEDALRTIIFEVLQQKTNLSPWNRAVEFIEQLKTKH